MELVEVVDTGGGFLGAALDAGQEVGILLMDEVGQIASVIQDHVQGLTVWEDDSLLNAPYVPGIKRNSIFPSGARLIQSKV